MAVLRNVFAITFVMYFVMVAVKPVVVYAYQNQRLKQKNHLLIQTQLKNLILY